MWAELGSTFKPLGKKSNFWSCAVQYYCFTVTEERCFIVNPPVIINLTRRREGGTEEGGIRVEDWRGKGGFEPNLKSNEVLQCHLRLRCWTRRSCNTFADIFKTRILFFVDFLHLSLKGAWQEISDFWFFVRNQFPLGPWVADWGQCVTLTNRYSWIFTSAWHWWVGITEFVPVQTLMSKYSRIFTSAWHWWVGIPKLAPVCNTDE
jgi:hypothetical protein